MKTLLAAAVLLLPLTAAAQQTTADPPTDPRVRALIAVNSELTNAWTSTRAMLIATQDQLDAAHAEIAAMKTRQAAVEAERARALPPPPPPATPPQ